MTEPKSSAPLVAVVMGSASDWETMRTAVELLEQLGVPNEYRIVSAHRTPELMADFARDAAGRGLRVIIAGAGGAAHLPGMIAAQTWLPVLGVPVESKMLKGVDSLLSIVQMPAASPSARWRSAPPARRTPRCSLPASSGSAMRQCALRSKHSGSSRQMLFSRSG
jgi:phosphoribosylaminoimidazole carboxylase PurE protein